VRPCIRNSGVLCGPTGHGCWAGRLWGAGLEVVAATAAVCSLPVRVVGHSLGEIVIAQALTSARHTGCVDPPEVADPGRRDIPPAGESPRGGSRSAAATSAGPHDSADGHDAVQQSADGSRWERGLAQESDRGAGHAHQGRSGAPRPLPLRDHRADTYRCVVPVQQREAADRLGRSAPFVTLRFYAALRFRLRLRSTAKERRRPEGRHRS
jgi:hypothetical protein